MSVSQSPGQYVWDIRDLSSNKERGDTVEVILNPLCCQTLKKINVDSSCPEIHTVVAYFVISITFLGTTKYKSGKDLGNTSKINQYLGIP